MWDPVLALTVAAVLLGTVTILAVERVVNARNPQ